MHLGENNTSRLSCSSQDLAYFVCGGNKGAPLAGLQEINGGVGCYAASRPSHCCVIKSNPKTLLCGCYKLLFLPAFKDVLTSLATH